jgi:Predicted transcriptional regulators
MEDLEIPKKNLARNLREQRTKLGLSQAGLAEKLGISMRTVQQVEQAGRFTSDETLAKMAAFFRVSVSDLLRNEGKPLENAPAAVPSYPGQVPALLLGMLAQLANDAQAMELHMALAARLLGIPVETTNRGDSPARKSRA